jgi:hypothetical protein
LWTFIAMTAFNPIFWNIVARNGTSHALPILSHVLPQWLTCRAQEQDYHQDCRVALHRLLSAGHHHFLLICLPRHSVCLSSNPTLLLDTNSVTQRSLSSCQLPRGCSTSARLANLRRRDVQGHRHGSLCLRTSLSPLLHVGTWSYW